MVTADGKKRCPSCRELKKASGNFYSSNRKQGDGFGAYCKECTKRHAIEWQKSNPEKKREIDARTRRKKSPEQKRHRAESQQRWRKRNREHVLETARVWRRAYKERDPERRRHQNQISNNAQRARRLGVQSDFLYADWLAVLEVFGYRCAFCSSSGALLDVEHLEPMAGGGGNVVGNVVPACRPCNAQKGLKSLEQYAAERGGEFDPEIVRRLAASVVRRSPFQPGPTSVWPHGVIRSH